jgi:hypothetical protein
MRALALSVAVLGFCVACGSSAAPARSQAGRPAFLLVLVQSPWATQVESVDAQGRVGRIIVPKVRSASVSPDGKLVALGEAGGLYVERTTGSRRRLLLRWSSVALWKNVPFFLWSPDSKQLLVSVSNFSRLAVVSVATGAERMFPVPAFEPLGWSGPAHEILLEATSGNYAERLLVAPPTGTSPRTVYSQDDSDLGSPSASLSPDGKWVAFTVEGLNASPYYPFGVVNVASGKTTPIDSVHDLVATPLWAPDSRRFVVGGPPTSLFSNRGVPLGLTDTPRAAPVAWTHAGLYLRAPPSAGSTPSLVLIPTGQKAAKTIFSLPRGWDLDQLVPLG